MVACTAFPEKGRLIATWKMTILWRLVHDFSGNCFRIESEDELQIFFVVDIREGNPDNSTLLFMHGLLC